MATIRSPPLSISHKYLHLLLLLTMFPPFSLPIPAHASSSPIISRLKTYLQIDTSHPNPNYTASTLFLLSQATDIGLQPQVLFYSPNKPVLIFSWMGSNPSLPSILLNSHTDVVPAEASKWHYPPFLGFEDSDGNIYGRGSQDTKSVGMQYLEAIRGLLSSGFTRPLRTVHVSFVPEEEVGGEDGMKKLVESKEYAKLNVGITFDEGLACEEDYYRVFFGERAVWKLVVRASSVEDLVEGLSEIYEFREKEFRMLKEGAKAEGEVVAVNNVFLRAGTSDDDHDGFVMNLQPSEAEAGFDIRLPPSVDIHELEIEIRTKWAPASRNFTYTLTQLEPRASKGVRLPASASEMNPWWDLLKGAVEKADGKLGAPMIRPSATDSRFIRNLGIPAFGFSPMSNTPSLLHDHNEFLNSREYLKGIKVYSEIIKAFSGYVDTSDS